MDAVAVTVDARKLGSLDVEVGAVAVPAAIDGSSGRGA